MSAPALARSRLAVGEIDTGALASEHTELMRPRGHWPCADAPDTVAGLLAGFLVALHAGS